MNRNELMKEVDEDWIPPEVVGGHVLVRLDRPQQRPDDGF
jgi:hypothetical protein